MAITEESTQTGTRWLGASVKRKEDERFVRGRGNYIDDIKLPRMLHMAVLRSPYAHAVINSIDTSRASALPGVIAVVTGALLAEHKLAWMPTLSGDTQAGLATDQVRMQGQEGPCGCVADVNPATGKTTIYMTSQAPHAHRTVFALVTGLPEQNIQIISPDIGGGFGNKVPIYPGYVVATAASLLLGRPVKWIEDRTGNLISTGFARDFYMDGELALRSDGTMTGLRVKMLSDQGYAYADAQPSKFKAGLFHIVTGSYDIPAAHVVTEGAYTNKAPGGVAYRCSFPVTEASYFVQRLVPTAPDRAGAGTPPPRPREFLPPQKVPHTSATGFEYDSGNYEPALDLALEKVNYSELRETQKRLRE